MIIHQLPFLGDGPEWRYDSIIILNNTKSLLKYPIVGSLNTTKLQRARELLASM